MTAPIDWPAVEALLGEPAGGTIVVLGRPPGGAPPAGRVVEIDGAEDLPAGLKADLGIVAHPEQFMPVPETMQLLARLRDVHCRRVLLWTEDPHWTEDRLRALGFLPAAGARSAYLYDPATFNEPREWNNPRHWAHPENFHKRRF